MIWRLLGVGIAGLGLASLRFGAIGIAQGEVTFATNRAGFNAVYADNPIIFLAAVLFYLVGGIFLFWLGYGLIRPRVGDV